MVARSVDDKQNMPPRKLFRQGVQKYLETFGTPKTVASFTKKVQKAHTMVDTAHGATGGRAKRALKKANKLLGAFIRGVSKNHKVDPTLGQRVVSYAGDAVSKLKPLTK